MNIQTNYLHRQNQYGESYRISYSAWGNPNASRSLVCVHGLNRNSRDFDFVADYLLNCDDYFIIAPDLPGRGNSDYLQDPRGYNLESSVADLIAVLMHLALPNPDFIGVSFGGILGMILASMPQKWFHKLILSDIGAEVELAGIARIAAYSYEQPDFATFAAAGNYLRSLSSSDGIYAEAVWQHMLLNSLQKNSAGHWGIKRDVRLVQALAGEGLPAGNIKFWFYWEKIKLPTLIIHGQQSDLLSSATITKMMEGNPSTQLLTVLDAGHSPYLYREEQLKVIAEFLQAE